MAKTIKIACDAQCGDSAEGVIIEFDAKKILESLIADYADEKNSLDMLKCRRDEKLAEVHKMFSEPIKNLECAVLVKFNKVKDFTLSHRDIFFKNGKKSDVTTIGEVRERLGNPKLVMPEGVKINDYADLFAEEFPGVVKTTLSVMPEAVIALRDDKKMQLILHKIGGKIVQQRSFIINLKKSA